MPIFSRITSIFRSLTGRKEKEQDLEQEVSSYLDLLTEEKVAQGMSPEEARRAARIELGGVDQVKEQVRDARAGAFLETVLQDVRYGARMLRRNPGFTAIVVLTLALGIGANTAIFSVVYGVLLRPLPYRNGEQLVVLKQEAAAAHVSNIPFSVKEILDYRAYNHTLQDVVEYHSMVFLLLGDDWAQRVQTAVVSANFFDVLGVKPLLGRTFVAADESPNADAVLVLSYEYWQSHLGGNPDIVGKIFQMNNRPHTVIGVLPQIPQYPATNDIYMPTVQCPFRNSVEMRDMREHRMMSAFGRLKPGVPLQVAQADLSAVAHQLEASYPESYPKAYGYDIRTTALQEELTHQARPTLLILLGAAGFVLLIACANVANLLLARLLKRERELAVRSALGATRGRLARQLLTETVLLALAGGAVGLMLAPPALDLLVKFAGRFTTRAAEIRIDGPVMLFTVVVSILSGLLFGLAPVFSGRQVNDALKQSSGQTTTSRGRHRLRAALVVGQVAISFTLLIGAGLMIRSFLRLENVDPGFKPDHVLTLRVSPSFTRYSTPAQSVALSKNILQRMTLVNGLDSAALASNFPFNPGGIAGGPGSTTFQIEGRLVAKGDLEPIVDATSVSAGYFETIRQPLLRGRTFTNHDDTDTQAVGIINQAMLGHRFADQDPVGKRISFDEGKTWITIVGVVGDAREYGLDHAPGDEVYIPLTQSGGGAGHLVVRTAADPAGFASVIRAALHEIDPQLAVDQVETIERLQTDSVASPRVTTILLGLFAALAVLISASGIAGVMALSISQRTHELGIRMALGQTKESILRMVVGQGLGLAVSGTVLGIVAAAALARLLSTLLFATSPTDTLTFGAVSLLFLSVATVSCFVPALNVTNIDPFTAVRQE
jgi:predicted permease